MLRVSPPPSFSFFLFQDSHLLRDRFSKINFPFWKMAYIQKCLRTSYLFLKKKLINNHKSKYIKIKLQYVIAPKKVHGAKRSFQRSITKSSRRRLHCDESMRKTKSDPKLRVGQGPSYWIWCGAGRPSACDPSEDNGNVLSSHFLKSSKPAKKPHRMN